MKRTSSAGRRAMARLLVVWTAVLAVAGFTAATASASNITAARFTLAQPDWSCGQNVSTGNTDINLIFQCDGNLVLYHGRTALWATGTNGHGVTDVDWSASGFVRLKNSAGATICTIGALTPAPGGSARVQDDGNFVFYSTANVAKWASDTSGARQGNHNYCFS